MACLARTWNGVKLPEQPSFVSVECGQKPPDPEFAPGDAYDDTISQRERCAGHGVPIAVVGDLDDPSRLAGIGIERDQKGIARGHENALPKHRNPAVRHAAAQGQPVGNRASIGPDHFARLCVERDYAVARTVESYRDAFELLFGFIEQSTGKPAAALQLADLDAPVVLDFLDHLETSRGNSVRTRNARLAAIHSFMRYAAVRDPASLPVTGRVLAIPAKRFDRPVLGYLSREQIAAILATPDRRTWSGQRDAVMLATTYNTGARVSEITALQRRNVLLDRQSAVHLHGKGRKERVIPLWRNTATGLRAWLDKINDAPDAPVFPSRSGAPMSRSGVRDRLDRAVAVAEQECPSLRGQHISPHTLRHSTAMHLLQSGTDLATIALWLGHSSPAVTHQYLEADLAAKEAVLQHLDDPSPAPTRFQPGDRLLAFLQDL